MNIIVVVCISLSVFFLVVIILSPFGKKHDMKYHRIDNVVLDKKMVITELDLSFYKRFFENKVNRIKKIFEEYILKKFNRNKKTAINNKLKHELFMAGIYMSVDEFTAIRFIVIAAINLADILVCVLTKYSPLLKLMIIVGGAILSVLIFRFYLSVRISSREAAIKNQLPEVMDLLCVSMEAGLGFDAALLKLTEKLSGPLIDALKLLQREVQMGKPRREALKNLSNYSDVPELKTFCSALISADALGITIKNVLKVQSDQLRVERRQLAQEKGMKSPVKMMLPMVLFIFPVIFIILLGPTVIQLTLQF